MTRFTSFALLLLLAGVAGFRPAAAMTPEERREYLAKLQQILPDVPSFREWLQKTGELPPDFDALPRGNALPEPLRFLDGRAGGDAGRNREVDGRKPALSARAMEPAARDFTSTREREIGLQSGP
jgi:hypothetical protein